jgi:uncharacterized membrane protein YphA (DoxX/SURF4 family)
MAESSHIERTQGAAFGLLRTAEGFLTNPASMIAMALLAVALFAMPFYLRTTEQQLFEGNLMLSLCGGLLHPLPAEDRRQARPPLL